MPNSASSLASTFSMAFSYPEENRIWILPIRE